LEKDPLRLGRDEEAVGQLELSLEGLLAKFQLLLNLADPLPGVSIHTRDARRGPISAEHLV
jgi:hypothetical protein